ncbi:MAG: phage major capsid protein [Planctomycetota bacterium]
MKENETSNDPRFDAFLASLAAKMQPAIAEGAQSALQELKLTAPRRLHGAVPGLVEGAPDDLPHGERSLRFFRAVLSGDHLAAKALAESTDSLGGYLVPSGFRDEVVKRLPQDAELAPYVRAVPVVSDTGSLPSLATDIAVTWRSAASSENTAFGETTPALGSVAWSLKRADAFTKMSRELVADSGPAVVEFITGLFREAIASERDRVIAVGDGSSEPYGIYSTAGIGSVAVGGSLTFAKLVEIEQSLARKYRTHARWILSGANLRRAYSLADEQSRPIFIRDVVAGVPEARILGYPVSQEDHLPDDVVFFGDLSYYLWFDRGEMGIESTNVGGDAFANHQTWIKVWERADGKVALAEAFVKGTGITG